MANIVKTYSMVNGQPADATQVNKNFDDIIAGVGDVATLRPTVASLGLDADIATLALPANTTISAAGAELINDASAAAQLTTLGVTATAAELNYVDGVTSAIQTQLNAKVASSTISAAGAALLDDANATAQRATLGLPISYASGVTPSLAQNAVRTIILGALGAYLVFVVGSNGNANWHGAWYVNIGTGTPGSSVTLLGAAAAQCDCIIYGGADIQIKNLYAGSAALSWSYLKVG